MDMTLYALLNKKIKGVISGVDSVQVKNQNLVFNFTNGSTQTMIFPTPADGKDGTSIKDIDINPANHLICTMSDNTTIDAGVINTVQGERGPAGEDGKNGKDGKNGQDGVDGISPIVTITESTGRHTVSISDKEGVKSFVVKDGSALDVDNYYTKDEVIAELATKANITDIPVVPVNVSEFTNDAGYIKNTVDNLIHYYNKADTYTQAEVNTLISNINKLISQVVDQIPTTLPANGGNADTVNEHTVEDNVPAGIFAMLPFKWELIGTSTPETGDTSTNTFKQTMSSGSPFCVYHSSGIFCFGNGTSANRGKLYGMTSGVVASVTYTTAGLLTVEVGSGTAYIYQMKTI